MSSANPLPRPPPEVSKLKAQYNQERAQLVQVHTREVQTAKERASSQLKQLEVEYGGRVAQVSEVGGESTRRVITGSYPICMMQ